MRSAFLACASLLLLVARANAQTPPAEPAPADANLPAQQPPAAEPAPPAAPVAAPPPPAAAQPAPAAAAPAAPAAPPGPRPAPAGPLKIETPSATVKLGFLLQPQYEVVGHSTLNSASQNLYVRRVRLLLGGTIFKDFEYFFDTDFANLFKTNTTTGANVKSTPGMNVQDAFGTWKALGDQLKVDVGYMLPALNHNALQGATTLYSWDYFNNSFRHSNTFNSSADPIGRDAGLQLRGLVLDGHIEYRVGLFQGRRNDPTTTKTGGRNMFRVAGRVQINLLDPEPGFFYAGTYLGAKKILSIGGSYDFQDSYKRWSVDAFADLPAGPGVFTAQVNLVGADGDDFLVNPPAMAGGMPTPALPKQTALMGEVGYLIDAANLSPIFRFEQQWYPDADTHETRLGGGLAFWPYGHNVNLKAFYQRVTPHEAAGTHGFNQFNLQTQFYVF